MWKTALSRPYHFKFFEDCFPRISLGPFLNTLLFRKVNVSKVLIDKLDISKYVCLFIYLFFIFSQLFSTRETAKNAIQNIDFLLKNKKFLIFRRCGN